MIERIVLLKLNEESTTAAALAEVVARSREVLPALPGVVECHVGLAADERTSDEWHVSLVLRFESADDIPPYVAHPDHRAYVDDFIRPRLASIAAHNFEI